MANGTHAMLLLELCQRGTTLTPTLSLEYKGEGVRTTPFTSSLLPCRQNSVVSAVVLEDFYVLELAVSRCDLAGEVALIVADFEVNPAAGGEAFGGAGEDSAVDGGAVEAAVEGADRLVVAHVSVEFFELAGGDVGRVADDQVEGLDVHDL